MLEKYDPNFNLKKCCDGIKLKQGFTTIKQCESYLRKMVPQESYFQKKIIKELKARYPDAFVQKISLQQYSGGAGFPDILMIYKGQYFGFEVKRPAGLNEASEIQKKKIEMLNKAGGIAIVCTYPEECFKVVDEWERKIGKRK